MKLYSILGSILFLLLPTYALATPQTMCPEKKLDSGSVEGIFKGADCCSCGEDCWATIQLDNGQEVIFDMDKGEAKRVFGKINNRVIVEYDVRQVWNEFDEHCSRVAVFRSGRQLSSGK